MNKTKIEWCDWTWNPITGCKNTCSYCYAKRISKRFKRGFEPTFYANRLNEPAKLKEPSKIFTVSMGEMFGDWIPNAWISDILDVISKNPQHIFQILTKYPKNLLKWSFPRNVWVGTTVTHDKDEYKTYILQKVEASVKFVSFEPLLERVVPNLERISWIIIGAQTNPEIQPKKVWVKELIDEARCSNIRVFLKNNLKWKKKIQEFPTVIR